jgi:hypothetical protein
MPANNTMVGTQKWLSVKINWSLDGFKSAPQSIPRLGVNINPR